MPHKISNLLFSMRYYLLPILLCWLLSAILLMGMGYHGSFLYLNSHYYPPLDYPMLFLTHLGDDVIVAAIFALILVSKKPETVMLMVISLLIAGLFSTIAKQLIFPHWDRPPKVFEGKNIIHTVGAYRLYLHSFPSGHSTSIAAACTVVASISQRSRLVMFLLALLTLTICYTRVYTGVHFLGDIMAGSLLGVVISISCILLFAKNLRHWFNSLTIPSQAMIKNFWIGIAGLALVITLFGQTGLF